MPISTDYPDDWPVPSTADRTGPRRKTTRKGRRYEQLPLFDIREVLDILKETTDGDQTNPQPRA